MQFPVIAVAAGCRCVDVASSDAGPFWKKGDFPSAPGQALGCMILLRPQDMCPAGTSFVISARSDVDAAHDHGAPADERAVLNDRRRLLRGRVVPGGSMGQAAGRRREPARVPIAPARLALVCCRAPPARSRRRASTVAACRPHRPRMARAAVVRAPERQDGRARRVARHAGAASTGPGCHRESYEAPICTQSRSTYRGRPAGAHGTPTARSSTRGS